MADEEKLNDNDLYDLVYKDDLTGLFNRRYYKEQVEKDAALLSERPFDYSLMMFDIDHFKSINDGYGHQEGDHVIRSMAALIKESVGSRGTAIRVAGDEFVVLMPYLTKDEARKLAWMLRDFVAETPIALSGSDVKLKMTVSIGIANLPGDSQDIHQLMHIADESLYLSKKKGRNTVSSIEEKKVEEIDSRYLYRYLPPRTFIGRDSLIRDFRHLIVPAPGEKKPLVIIEGVRGSGKSRVLSELSQFLDPQRIMHLRFQSQPMTAAQPFWEIVDTLNRKFAEDPELASMLATTLTQKKIKEIAPLMPLFTQFFLQESKTEELTPAERRDLLLETLEEMLLYLDRKKPLIMTIDDFQWSNLGTQMLLEKLKSHEKANHIAVFVTFNREESIKSKDTEFLSFIERLQKEGISRNFLLAPMPDEEVERLMASIIPGLEGFEHLREFVKGKSQGIPLIVEDIIKFLIHKSVIHTVEGQLAVEDFREDIFPSTLEGIVNPGILALDEEVRGLLCKASVIGQSFSVDLLKKVDGRAEAYVEDLIAKAQKASIITSDPASDIETFTFSGNATRATIYESMDEEEKKAYHKQLAEIEMEIHKDDIETVLSKIAFHFKQSGDVEQARYFFNELMQNYENILAPNVIELYIDSAPPDKEWAKETKLSVEDEARALQFLKLFQVTTENIARFPIDSEIVRGAFESTFWELNKIMNHVEVISFSDGDGEVLINGRRPTSSGLDKQAEEKFLKAIAAAGLKGITLKKGITKEEFLQFLKLAILESHDMLQNKGGWTVVLNDLGIRSIVTNERIFVAFAERDLFDKKRIKDDEINIRRKDEAAQKSTTGKDLSGLVKDAPALVKDSFQELLKLKDLIVENADWGQDVEKVRELLDKIFEKHGIIENFVSILKEGVTHIEEEARKSREAEHHLEPPPEKTASGELLGLYRRLDALTLEKLRLSPDVLVKDLESPDGEKAISSAASISARGQEAIPILMGYLKSTDNMLGRKRALHILKKIIPHIDNMLIDELIGGSLPEEKRRIIEVLHDFSDIDIIEGLRIFLRSPENEVRQAVTDLIVSRPTAKSMELLMEIVSGRPTADDAPIINDAIVALGKMKCRAAVPLLMKLIRKKTIFVHDPFQGIQEKACLALGKISDPLALPSLFRALSKSPFFFLLRNKSNRVRAAAAFALSSFPVAEARSHLERAARDPLPDVRSAASLALHSLERKLPKRSESQLNELDQVEGE
jgi:diguanylate cyclase (GGDEF)-like protein